MYKKTPHGVFLYIVNKNQIQTNFIVYCNDMNRSRVHQGFTLIELLVVIAIIGILASVVLESLNSARDKGTNAAIRANFNSTRSQASIYSDEAGGVYEVNVTNSVCVNDNLAAIKGIADNVAAADALNIGVGDTICNDDPVAWAAAAQLVGDSSGEYFCVDSVGFGGDLLGTVGPGETFDTQTACN